MRTKAFGVVMIAGVVTLSPGARAQSAVEWKASDGGNGHWYEGFVRGSITPEAAAAEAETMGATLVSLETQEEGSWVFGNVASRPELWTYTDQWALGPWIGLRRNQSSWVWASGQPLTYAAWLPGEPNGPASHVFVHYYDDNRASPGTRTIRNAWNDIQSTNIIPSFVVEWSADCNGDGVVDYGQVVTGELADADGNTVPDCCEREVPCAGTVAINGSFEAGTPLSPCATETISSGTALGTGWMVTAGAVQRVRSSANCAAQGTPKFGDFFIDLLDAGEIRQAVATQPGRSYRLTFWLSGDCAGGPSTKRVTASLGSAAQTFDHVCSGTGAQAWRSCTVEFIANAAITTLSLRSAAGGASNGPLVDSVRVEDISISCPGDVDGDGSVTGGDIGLVLLNFGDCPSN